MRWRRKSRRIARVRWSHKCPRELIEWMPDSEAISCGNLKHSLELTSLQGASHQDTRRNDRRHGSLMSSQMRTIRPLWVSLMLCRGRHIQDQPFFASWDSDSESDRPDIGRVRNAVPNTEGFSLQTVPRIVVPQSLEDDLRTTNRFAALRAPEKDFAQAASPRLPVMRRPMSQRLRLISGGCVVDIPGTQ